MTLSDKPKGKYIEDLAVGKLTVVGQDQMPRIVLCVDEDDDACVEFLIRAAACG